MDSGDEDELATGARDFYRMRDKLFKIGYVEGVSKAETIAGQLFSPHQMALIDSFIQIGKLIGVVEAAISVSPEFEETLGPFQSRLEAHCEALIAKSDMNSQQLSSPTVSQEIFPTPEESVEELKSLYPGADNLINSLFGKADELPKDTSNEQNTYTGGACVKSAAFDMSKLSF